MNRAERRRLDKLKSRHTRRKIWLALPCYGGTLAVATLRSLIHDMFPLIMRGDEIKIFDEVGHADIYSLRAQIVSHFLSDPHATDLVMVDNDVAWDAHGLARLLDHPVDFVAGSYPKRDFPIKYMFRSDGQPLWGDPDTGLIEVWGMPGGFMKMSRRMLERMADHYRADLECFDTFVPTKRTVRMFDPYWYTDEDGRRRVLSEDYAFCQRWRDIGGKIYMDASIPMAHIGTHAFKGCLGKWLDETQEKANAGPSPRALGMADPGTEAEKAEAGGGGAAEKETGSAA